MLEKKAAGLLYVLLASHPSGFISCLRVLVGTVSLEVDLRVIYAFAMNSFQALETTMTENHHSIDTLEHMQFSAFCLNFKLMLNTLSFCTTLSVFV